MKVIMTAHYHSPVGEMLLGSYGDRLCLCDWAGSHRRDMTDRRTRRLLRADYVEGMTDVISMTQKQLDEYFAGQRMAFYVDTLFAGSEFQCRVWRELMNIPYGTTISYAELAGRIGNPAAVRAVASANASNPMSIIVPCHRVIGSDNKLTGYAGGLSIKRSLLSLEAETKKFEQNLWKNLHD